MLATLSRSPSRVFEILPKRSCAPVSYRLVNVPAILEHESQGLPRSKSYRSFDRRAFNDYTFSDKILHDVEITVLDGDTDTAAETRNLVPA